MLELDNLKVSVKFENCTENMHNVLYSNVFQHQDARQCSNKVKLVAADAFLLLGGVQGPKFGQYC